jgi:trk system potassium uptake protein TrkH
MLIPLIYDSAVKNGSCLDIFLASILVCVFIGVCLILACKTSNHISFSQKDIYFLVAILWLLVALFSATPLLLYGGPNIDFVTAFFEASSGLTTTGVSIYDDVNSLPEAINIWRMILHFIGGVGIVSIAMMIMPNLRVGGMQLFQTENSDKSQKFLPRASQIASIFVFTYVSLIIIFSTLFHIFGMNILEAICYSVTSISTGGFVINNGGLGTYDSVNIEIIAIVGMFIGGITFMEIVHLFRGGVRRFYKSQQTKVYAKLYFGVIVFILVYAFIKNGRNLPLKTVINLIFDSTSSMTTSGLTVSDGAYFGPLFRFMFIVLSTIGGCVGSTTGGIKIFRLQVVWTVLKVNMKKLIKPYNVDIPKYNGKTIDDNLITSVLSFIALFVISFVVSVFLMCILDSCSLSTASAAVTSCITNAGLPLNFIMDTTVSYADFNTYSKLILIMDMFIGRLELVPIFMVLSSVFWKR